MGRELGLRLLPVRQGGRRGRIKEGVMVAQHSYEPDDLPPVRGGVPLQWLP